MPSGRRGAFARGTSARLNPCFCCLCEALFAERHGPNLAREPELAEHDEILRHRLLRQARDHGQCDGQICRRLADAQAADDVREHVAVARSESAMPVQHREQQPQALRIESLREPPRRLRLRAIDERLNLHQHGPRTLASHERDAAGHRRRVPREEDRRWILDLAKALLAHHEETHLVRGAEAILDGAHDSKAAAEIALEIQHGVDHVLEHPRPRECAFLRHVADEQRRHVVRLREPHELRRALAHLTHRARRRLQLLAEQRLDRIDREHAELLAGTDASQDRLDTGLGQELERHLADA